MWNPPTEEAIKTTQDRLLKLLQHYPTYNKCSPETLRCSQAESVGSQSWGAIRWCVLLWVSWRRCEKSRATGSQQQWVNNAPRDTVQIINNKAWGPLSTAHCWRANQYSQGRTLPRSTSHNRATQEKHPKWGKKQTCCCS